MAHVLSCVLLFLDFGVSVMIFYAIAVGFGCFSSDTYERRATASYALVDCALPPSPAAANISAFRESLRPLLAALPAAAAPPGFASLQSDDDRAFVRGLCLGLLPEKDCLACLAAAAENLTDSCLGASRRAGTWRSEGCFLAYADADTPSAREDAFRQVFLGGEDPGEDPNSYCFDPRRLVALAQSMGRRHEATLLGAEVATDAAALARDATANNTRRSFSDVAKSKIRVRVQGQCAWDSTAAECARCLGESARQVPPCSWDLDSAHARVADVVGYSCFLRIEKPAATWLTKRVAIELCVLLLLAMFASSGIAFYCAGL
ncbi:unnamed protein product [Alopecurus aequalis]